ncbi:MAG: hypothetical protein PHN49_06015 [Candidatus Omnitrophica bacterium]|nr:hypothetical protein [Candidatus Omnitrophota bacterium]MDD5671174.1 hypothetical protein [Candidatus Omnitrophota bacterium]
MINMVAEGHLSYIQSIVAVLLTTTFIPCFPDLAAMSKEIGLRNTLMMTVAILVSSVLLAGGLSVILMRVMK